VLGCEYVPAGQASHDEEPGTEIEPSGHAVQGPPLSEYVFCHYQPSPQCYARNQSLLTAGHRVHDVDPASELVPASQGAHPRTTAQYVPAEQAHRAGTKPPRSWARAIIFENVHSARAIAQPREYFMMSGSTGGGSAVATSLYYIYDIRYCAILEIGRRK